MCGSELVLTKHRVHMQFRGALIRYIVTAGSCVDLRLNSTGISSAASSLITSSEERLLKVSPAWKRHSNDAAELNDARQAAAGEAFARGKIIAIVGIVMTITQRYE